jgi:hypothetical protein
MSDLLSILGFLAGALLLAAEVVLGGGACAAHPGRH